MENIITFFLAYVEGIKWFFKLVFILFWENSVYLYHNSMPLFAIYMFFLITYTKKTFEYQSFMDELLITDYPSIKTIFGKINLVRGSYPLIFFSVVISLVSLFYNFLWLPNPRFWSFVKEIIDLIYVTGLKNTWEFHWSIGITYFLFVNLGLGLIWIIHLTATIHGDLILKDVQIGNYDRAALNEHNKFMQLVNIEKAITRLEHKK